MTGLEGKRIGVAATRSADVITKLIENNDGISNVFSIQGEQILNKKTSEEDVFNLLSNSFDLILLTTGIGAQTLEEAAHHTDCFPSFIHRLKDTNLAVRGSKTMNWLKKHSLQATFVSKDGTMSDLLDSLAVLKPSKQVFLQAYNQDDVTLKNKLENLGHKVYLSKPYQYKAPKPEILEELKQNIINKSLDAVIFTSKTQVQNLFGQYSETKEMADAFNDNILAVAVGKVTASELEQNGVSNVFHPANPKMGAMVIELVQYYDSLMGSQSILDR
ncbi:uroporphyrinogen-III synthase [Virgibacillus ainsalahensis]